jgi:hypothetical protein
MTCGVAKIADADDVITLEDTPGPVTAKRDVVFTVK